MIPVFAASTCFSSSQAKTLEHCALLLERIIVALAAAESIAEVVIVLVVHIGLLGVNPTSSVSGLVQAESTWACRWDALGTAVACEVALLEDLDEGMFAVALDRTSIADTCRGPVVAFFRWWGVASQASKDSLSQRAENFGACINALQDRKSTPRPEEEWSGNIRKEVPRGHRLQELPEIE